MKKIIIKLMAFSILLSINAMAHPECNCNKHKPTFKERKEIDNILESRLKLTEEQKNYIDKNRPIHQKEMEKIIDKMQKLHNEIRDVYLSGIPKFQADLKTAPQKAELVILKQNADKMKQEHRKNFENILNEEQKIEFEKIKKEYSPKKEQR